MGTVASKGVGYLLLLLMFFFVLLGKKIITRTSVILIRSSPRKDHLCRPHGSIISLQTTADQKDSLPSSALFQVV